MQNYVNNNLMIIKEFEELYKNRIDITSVIKKFRNEELIIHNGFDYGRFRIFVDSCLLLLNKEKLNNYYKNSYTYKDFMDRIQNDTELMPYLSFIKKEPIYRGIKGEYLYYSLEGKEKNPWNQVATIRIAMAHMQYGNFAFQESGQILYYFLYNKDKGIRKDLGIVFEPIVHKFIHAFFSNYSYGLLFRNTFFSKYSLEKNVFSRDFNYYYEITLKDNVHELYNGYNSSLMCELAKISRNENILFEWMEKNKEQLNIKEMVIDRNIDFEEYNKTAKKYHLVSKEEYFYGLKTVLDFETELSNFLVHISQLNEVLYDYCVLRDCGKCSSLRMEKYKEQLQVKILELAEDENAKLAFEIGFVYLRTMNFLLRVEDDDYIPLRYEEVDVSMFCYEEDAFKEYVQNNNILVGQLQHYIIERMRNAMMHGNINISIAGNGEVIVIFSDIYNKREDNIKISLDELKVCLLQDCLFKDVPKHTMILTAR